MLDSVNKELYRKYKERQLGKNSSKIGLHRNLIYKEDNTADQFLKLIRLGITVEHLSLDVLVECSFLLH